jgi:ribosomal protein S18 acetylase RimI-like enzyme
VTARFPDEVRRLVVRERGAVVGQAVLNLVEDSAGLYDMGVVPRARRRGVCLALTVAACRLARDLGGAHVTLNATEDGEPLYRRAGFESLGFGRTWWLFRRRAGR